LSEVPATYDRRVDPERAAATDRLVATFAELMHRMMSVHAPEFLEVGLTMSQAKVLYLVQAEPSIRMAELSARLGVSLSTISGVVDRLVDQGMLTRSDDPADRRQVVIRATSAGVEHLDRLRELNAGQLRLLLARVDADDLPAIEHALDILAAAADGRPERLPAPLATEGDKA
jgi:DNA-binding MarR family transcriptional regulator